MGSFSPFKYSAECIPIFFIYIMINLGRMFFIRDKKEVSFSNGCFLTRA